MESQGGLPMVRIHYGSCPFLGSLGSSGEHSNDEDGLPRGPLLCNWGSEMQDVSLSPSAA